MNEEGKRLEDYVNLDWVNKLARDLRRHKDKTPVEMATYLYSIWNKDMFSGLIPEDFKQDPDKVELAQLEWTAHMTYALLLVGWDHKAINEFKSKMLDYLGIEYDEEEREEDR